MMHQLWRRVYGEPDAEDYDEVVVGVEWTSWLFGFDWENHGAERSLTWHLGPLYVWWFRMRWDREAA